MKKEWPTATVFKCNKCGHEATTDRLNWDDEYERYDCPGVDDDTFGPCDGKMEYLKEIPAEYVSIGLYETHRAYGGPEEGGWYYDAGTLCHATLRNFTPEHWGKDHKDAGHAQWYYNVLKGMAEERNAANRKDIFNELRYHASLMVNTTLPAHYPPKRPQYR